MLRIFVVCLCLVFVNVHAARKIEDSIKYRQSAYQFMRWNMGVIKRQVVKNPASYNREEVIAAADVINAISKSGIRKLFPMGSHEGKGWKKTRVKPEYFDDKEEISKLSKRFSSEASKLAIATRSGDVNKIEGQFKKLFKACKSCHKKYRQKNK